MKEVVFRIAALLIFGWAPMAGAQIFTWTEAGDHVGNPDIASMIRLNSYSVADMYRTANKLAARRPGMRCVFLWSDNHTIFHEPGDRIDAKTRSYWWPKGIEKSLACEASFVGQLKAAGVKPDEVLLDNEDQPSRWGMSPEELAAVAADPHGKAVGIFVPQNEDQGMALDAVTAALCANAFRDGIFAPLKAYAPDATFDDFCDVLRTQAEGKQVPDGNGHCAFRTAIAGNVQSPALYGGVGLYLPTHTAFGNAAYSVNGLRQNIAHGPVWPWFASDNLPNAPWKDTDYWGETIRHALLTCGLHGFLFDPSDETAATKLSPIYNQTKQMVGGHWPEKLSTTDLIDYDKPFFVTARETAATDGGEPKRIVGRVTFAPNIKTASFSIAGKNFTVSPEVGQSGAWFEYPKATGGAMPTTSAAGAR